MDKRKRGKRAIKMIAEREGKSVKEIRGEINKAIEEAYRNPVTRSKWDGLFGEGRMPSPEEFIEVMADKVKNETTTYTGGHGPYSSGL